MDVHDEDIVVISNKIIEKEVLVIEETIETVESSEKDNLNQAFLVSNFLFFKCEMCDFASARKTELRNHKKQVHNWCFICFSSFVCQQNLKDHFYQVHSKMKQIWNS